MPVATGERGIDVCYSCSQKGLGAPSGLAPIAFSARARAARVPSPQLLPGSGPARGLLVEQEVSPHALRAADVRPRRSARRGGRGGARGALRPPSAPSRGAGRRARAHGAVAAAARRRAPVDAERRARAGRRGRGRGPARAAADEFNMEIGAGLGPLAGKDLAGRASWARVRRLPTCCCS